MRIRTSSSFGGPAKAAGALFLVAGTVGLVTSVAGAGTHGNRQASPAAVLHGHTCTVVATGRHRHVVGHSGDVVCGLRGNDTLTAVGPGTVYLIAGRGRDKLIASSDPNAHDVLIAGTGSDTIVAGTGGDDIVDEGTGNDTITCGSGGTVTVVDDNSQSDSQGDSSQGNDNQGDDNSQGDNQDCQGDGNVQGASLDFGGTITMVDNTAKTMTVQWSDVNSAAQAWLDSQTPPDPATVTFDISTATIEAGNGGTLVPGDDVEVAANPPASGTTPVAVDVQADTGDGSD